MVARENDVARQQDKIKFVFNFMLGGPAQFLLCIYNGLIPRKYVLMTTTIK